MLNSISFPLNVTFSVSNHPPKGYICLTSLNFRAWLLYLYGAVEEKPLNKAALTATRMSRHALICIFTLFRLAHAARLNPFRCPGPTEGSTSRRRLLPLLGANFSLSPIFLLLPAASFSNAAFVRRPL